MKVRDYRVYYIDLEEGINDLIDLFKRTMAKKLALVIHDRMLLLNSPINLKLIKQYAERFQKEIVFINPDPIIIDKVSHYGFKIFPDLNALESGMPFQAEAAGLEENNDDEGVEKKDGRQGFGLFPRIFGLFLIFLILVMAYLYFLYPTATVEIKPVVKQAKEQLVLYGSTSINQIDWENHVLPLHKIEVDITCTDEVKTTGAKLIGETKATGVIKFINEGKKEVTIPAGTIVETGDGIKFRTVKELVVPKLEVDYLMDLPVGMRAGQAEVKIEALQKGSGSNVSTGRIKKLTKELENIYVINPEPTRGGRDKRIPIVTEEDKERLKKNLEEKLRSRLITKLYQEMGGNYRIIEEEINFSNPEISFDHQIGEVADILQASGSLTASGYLVRNNELDRLVTTIFQDHLQENLQLLSSGIYIEELKLAEKERGLYNIELELLAPVIPKIDSAALIKKLQGRDIKSASKFLQGRSDIEEYRIETRGNSLPRFGFAIKVMVSEPDSFQVFKRN